MTGCYMQGHERTGQLRHCAEPPARRLGTCRQLQQALKALLGLLRLRSCVRARDCAKEDAEKLMCAVPAFQPICCARGRILIGCQIKLWY